jgi:hypothetical protein
MLLLLLFLPGIVLAQQEVSLTQPPYIETNILTIANLASSTTIKTTFTYIAAFDK